MGKKVKKMKKYEIIFKCNDNFEEVEKVEKIETDEREAVTNYILVRAVDFVREHNQEKENPKRVDVYRSADGEYEGYDELDVWQDGRADLVYRSEMENMDEEE